MVLGLSGSDLKAYTLEATRTWHVQHEFSDFRCDIVFIRHKDNILTRGVTKIKSKQFSEFRSRTTTSQTILQQCSEKTNSANLSKIIFPRFSDDIQIFRKLIVRSVPRYHFKVAYVVLQMAVKEFFKTHF